MTNPLKVGLIGTGSIAQLHRNAYNKFPEKVKLTMVEDPTQNIRGVSKSDVIS